MRRKRRLEESGSGSSLSVGLSLPSSSRRQSDLAFPVLPSLSRALSLLRRLIRDSARFSLGHREMAIFQRFPLISQAFVHAAVLSLSLSLSLSLTERQRAERASTCDACTCGAVDLLVQHETLLFGTATRRICTARDFRFEAAPLPRKTSTVGNPSVVGKCETENVVSSDTLVTQRTAISGKRLFKRLDCRQDGTCGRSAGRSNVSA